MRFQQVHVSFSPTSCMLLKQYFDISGVYKPFAIHQSALLANDAIYWRSPGPIAMQRWNGVCLVLNQTQMCFWFNLIQFKNLTEFCLHKSLYFFSFSSTIEKHISATRKAHIAVAKISWVVIRMLCGLSNLLIISVCTLFLASHNARVITCEKRYAQSEDVLIFI